MKKKNGFIAISLIYSFFLFFLMVMLASSVKTIQARQLLNIFKDDLKTELNQDAFVKLTIPQKVYSVSEEVDFIGEDWQVVQDKNDSVVLILKRSLRKKEILSVLDIDETNTDYFSNSCNNDVCKIRMCMNQFSNQYCYYKNNSNALNYSWETSIGKVVLERWFSKNENFQKICDFKYQESLGQYECQKDTLIKMSFTDQRRNYTGYIRLINYLDEVHSNTSIKNQKDSWYNNTKDSWSLTAYTTSASAKKSKIYGINGSTYQNENVLALHPVIEVRKS